LLTKAGAMGISYKHIWLCIVALTAFDAITAGIYVEFFGGGEWNPLSYYLYKNLGF